MTHPLVDQLRFTRSEFVRGLAEVTGPEAQQRFGNMNCISWIVGHLAWQEQRYWLQRAQGQILLPELNEMLAYGKPASTLPAEEMWNAWRDVTQATDPWLDAITPETIKTPLAEGLSNIGTFLLRVIYHYWYHLGEGIAIRQMLGHQKLPDFVGNIDAQAPYRPEDGSPAAQEINKDSFIQKVHESRARLDNLLNQFDQPDLLQPLENSEWTLKDVIAHITWHEREMLGILKTRVFDGSPYWNLELDERNQAIFDENRGLSLESALSEAKETYHALIQELERLKDEDLHDPDSFAGMPDEWRPWQILADNTYLHYLDHLVTLERWWAKNNPTAPLSQ